ncbi:hypothetical protein [Paraburkholderia fynbosensis]|uniref:Uncharacterized protein n=1 Tax=Paraburkholderia fynbosensis TaxID=1200993 RepID=A0A6J5GT04_9BURK|nr:hypothetical protein [Paraburkholderia fynbosensis]CAB3806397.1 hypothetical protein LMG27177_06066 [Paraburkholderia fynbosensis]
MNIFDVQKVDCRNHIFDRVRFPYRSDTAYCSSNLFFGVIVDASVSAQAIDDLSSENFGQVNQEFEWPLLSEMTTSKKRSSARAFNRRSE